MRNHRTQLLMFAMLAGFVLWLTSPGDSNRANASWWGTLSDETRYYAGLSGSALGGVTPGGVAEYRDRDSRRRLEVSASSINLAAGTSLSVRVNGSAVGNMTVDSFGNAGLSLDTDSGNSVPATSVGASLTVVQNSTTIMSGIFSTTPPPSPSPGGSPSASPSPGGSPSASPSPSGSPSASPSPSPSGSPSASPSPSPSGSPSASPSPSPSGSPSASPSPSGSPGSSGEQEIQLSGSAINGITPTGRAKYEADSFATPESGRELEVRADDVNLQAGTVLNVEVNGASVGTMSLRTSGRAELRLYGGAVPLITTGTGVAVKSGSNTILFGVFSGTPSPSPSPSPSGSPGASPSPSPGGSPGATPSPSPSGSPGASPSPSPSASPSPAMGNCAMSLGAANYSKEEGGNSVSVTINRTCTTAGASSVDLESASGSATDRTDFIQASTRVSFAEGETSKTVNVILVNDNYVEGAENFTVALEAPAGGAITGIAQATVNIADDDTGAPTTNPFEAAEFFVRQHYSDFLSREPDTSGLSYWTNQVASCGTDQACASARRIAVSAAFFIELEFQDTGSFIYRLYKASLGRRPIYAEFAPDRARIVGGAELAQSKLNFSNDWVTRPAFRAEYPENWIPEQFVNRLFDNAGLVGFADERQAQINAMYGGRPRAEVVRQVIEIPAFKSREYNPSFVLMQYFGYLRREPDQGGYDFWLGVLNNQPQNFRGMVCAFITSQEMQQRFSSLAPRGNGECN